MSTYYQIAKERYAKIGVDTEDAIKKLQNIAISIHCWQGDDVAGFENVGELSGGIQVTGNYPGKARNPAELMADYDKAISLIPGKHRINLHASYAIFEGETVARDAIEPAHFAKWIQYAKERGLGIDFNPTFFGHPMVKDNLTLSSPCETTR
ncbi:MAG: L-rhamnose isomerase, partial [Firmicutes bacterium]|nr:L-rhamnose isomerase [Bacillota bacterium]